MSFTINLSPDKQAVTMRVSGLFDMSAGFALWQQCQTDQSAFHSFTFDFTDVQDLRDSGLGWLVMFKKSIHAQGADIKIIHTQPEVARRCLNAGLHCEDTHIQSY